MVAAEFLPKKDLKPGWNGASLDAVLHGKFIAFNRIAYCMYKNRTKRKNENKINYYRNTIKTQFFTSYMSDVIHCQGLITEWNKTSTINENV